ncbi:MAG: hypothetical protein LBQ22_08890 [Bacteroidales bacterium]|jgi:bleomycin hydrolase|nr:hypothetical protein [Bacteroidales bacterium]
MKKIISIIFLLIISVCTFSQTDKGKFVTYPAGFYQNVIMRELTGKSPAEQGFKPQKQFRMDFEGNTYPTDMSQYEVLYHSLTVSQGNSGTCWAYAATSFMESEAFRQHRIKVKISEMFTVYWEYIERAEHFVSTKGNTNIGEGSESNAILRIMKNHGMMPFSVYSGLREAQSYNDHAKMFEEFDNYLKSVKESESWDKEQVITDVKVILEKYMGTPPETFTYEGKEYTPETFMTDYLKLEPNRYFSFMSTKEYTYNEKHELVEFDNWWHCKDYYNLNLDDYISLLNKSVTSGYTVSICGDVSEPGYDQIAEVAVVPDFDIPSAYINEDSRQLRLSNHTTEDDHCIHIVGYQNINGVNWYLIKDSGSGAFDGKNKGYRFYHEDYIRLKIMNYMIHVDIAREILDRIIK